MTIQLSDLTRHASLGSVEKAVGPGAFLVIRTGPAPAETDDPDTGMILAVVELPQGWASVAAGSYAIGPWARFRARTTGTAGHFRIYTNDGECCVQGRITADGDGGDVTLDIVDFVPGRAGEIVSFAFWKAEGSRPERTLRKRLRILAARRRGIAWHGGGAGGSNDLRSILDGIGHGANLLCCLDAGSIDSWPGSGQAWVDLSDNQADFYRGTDGSSEGEDPIFNGTPGGLSEAEYWSGAGSVFTEQSAFGAQDFHKSGAAFTFAAIVYCDDSGTGRLIDTLGAGTDGLYADFSSGFALNVNGGSTFSTAEVGASASWHFLALSFDRNGGATGIIFVIDDVSEIHNVSEVGAASANPPAISTQLLSNGNSSARVCGAAIWSVDKTADQLETIRAALKAQRWPSLYEST